MQAENVTEFAFYINAEKNQDQAFTANLEFEIQAIPSFSQTNSKFGANHIDKMNAG